MQKGSRVKCTRRNLFHLTTTPAQKAALSRSYSDNAWFYGTVVKGNSTRGFNVKFDDLPLEEKVVTKIRKHLLVLHDEVKENTYDARAKQLLEDQLEEARTKHRKPETLSEEKFLKKTPEEMMTAESFTYQLDKDDDTKCITWKIHAEGDDIRNCETFARIQRKKQPEFQKEIKWENSMADNFFDLVWADMEGSSAKILDEFLNDSRCKYYNTYTNDNIKFHDEEAEDKDWKVKQCILVLIAGASENENGIKALWKSGYGKGRKPKPDFGKYVSQNEMKCFMHGAASQ